MKPLILVRVDNIACFPITCVFSSVLTEASWGSGGGVLSLTCAQSHHHHPNRPFALIAGKKPSFGRVPSSSIRHYSTQPSSTSSAIVLRRHEDLLCHRGRMGMTCEKLG